MRKTCREGILTLILITLFLIGCQVERAESLSTITSLLNDFSVKLSKLEQRIEYIESKNLPKTVDTSECVKFIRSIDTHAVASVTIPVDGKYYVSTWNEPESVNLYKSGTIISRIKMLIRDTCPDFDRMKRAGLIK